MSKLHGEAKAYLDAVRGNKTNWSHCSLWILFYFHPMKLMSTSTRKESLVHIFFSHKYLCQILIFLFFYFFISFLFPACYFVYVAMSVAQQRMAESVDAFYDDSAALAKCGLQYKDSLARLDEDIRQEMVSKTAT